VSSKDCARRVWTQPDNAVADFIVKQKSSSFGKGIRGPSKTLVNADPERRLLADECYEQFVVGTIAKAWYWKKLKGPGSIYFRLFRQNTPLKVSNSTDASHWTKCLQ